MVVHIQQHSKWNWPRALCNLSNLRISLPKSDHYSDMPKTDAHFFLAYFDDVTCLKNSEYFESHHSASIGFRACFPLSMASCMLLWHGSSPKESPVFKTTVNGTQ